MKKIIYVALVSLLAMGCNAHQGNSDEFQVLNDSIVNIFQYASMRNDTVRLEEALNLTDELQKLAKSPEQKRLYYINRGLIVSSLGRFEEAMELKELYIQTLPEDNPERLRYNEYKKMWNRYLSLKDKYEGDSRKDKIVEILANWEPMKVPMELAKDEYSSYAVLILEECQSEASIKAFMEEVLANMGFGINSQISEEDLEQLSKNIFRVALK